MAALLGLGCECACVSDEQCRLTLDHHKTPDQEVFVTFGPVLRLAVRDGGGGRLSGRRLFLAAAKVVIIVVSGTLRSRRMSQIWETLILPRMANNARALRKEEKLTKIVKVSPVSRSTCILFPGWKYKH